MYDDIPPRQLHATDDKQPSERASEMRRDRDEYLHEAAELKVKLAQARDLGLDDDPVIKELAERVEQFDDALGYGPTVTDELRDRGVSDELLEELPESNHEPLLQLVKQTRDFAEQDPDETSALAEQQVRHLVDDLADHEASLSALGLDDVAGLPELVADGDTETASLTPSGDTPRERLARAQDQADQHRQRAADAETIFERMEATQNAALYEAAAEDVDADLGDADTSESGDSDGLASYTER